MDPPPKPSSALFDVYLRLRPSNADRERFLDVEAPSTSDAPTHITIKPPVNDPRKRAVEKFAFTRVFEEDAGQTELFKETGAVQMIEGVLGARGREGKDALMATLGVTGSGKVCLMKNLSARTMLNNTTEPHNPRFKVPAWFDTAHARRALPTHSTLPGRSGEL